MRWSGNGVRVGTGVWMASSRKVWRVELHASKVPDSSMSLAATKREPK
jgi:hypothetical protein